MLLPLLLFLVVVFVHVTLIHKKISSNLRVIHWGLPNFCTLRNDCLLHCLFLCWQGAVHKQPALDKTNIHNDDIKDKTCLLLFYDIMQAFVAVLIKNGRDCSLYTFYVDDQGLSQKKNWGLYLGDCFEFAPNFLWVRFLNSTKFVCGVWTHKASPIYAHVDDLAI